MGFFLLPMVSEELINRCRNDDRKAHHELYKSCFGILMSVCIRYRKNQDEAAELMNTGFLKVLRSLKTYRMDIPFDAWIRRIMINTIISDYHKNKKYKEKIDYNVQEFDRISKGADQNLGESNMQIELIMNAMNHLPDTARKVLNLYVFEGFTHDEISGKLGISQGTSKWHLHEARKKLQVFLKKLSV